MNMFQPINGNDLVVGQKYKIKYSSRDHYYHTGIFKHIAINQPCNYQVFDRVILYFGRCNTPQNTYDDNVSIQVFQFEFTSMLYYAFVSQKEQIQQSMEQRALNKILKRLVNDDFTW